MREGIGLGNSGQLTHMGGKRKKNAGSKESRIQHIEGLMRSFEFVRGETIKGLAKDWGVSEQYCRQLSAEASKRIRAAVMDPDTVNATVGSALEDIIHKGMTGQGGVKYRDIIDAAKAWALISGSSAPSKHEVTGKDGAPVCGPVIFVPPESEDSDAGIDSEGSGGQGSAS